ncbi:putative disease resistance protein rga3 [Phtheirospermum japonicum]|uniref:Putative disease resistance protein rga3 n=1 Tax=Phtheirospermum japonicum TaxID=374723 RepID=A0A830B7R9_9LAMI|nr:putative disease resistance protein rga3 [Phtheirospermum japonicum]
MAAEAAIGAALEISLVRGFNKDLETLKNSFLMIQDFLDDADEQQITNRSVNRWLKKLESVAFDADNVLDELSYHLLSRKTETHTTMTKKVQSFLKLGHKIRDISKKLELINQEATSFGLQIRLAGAQDRGVGSGAPASFGTDSFAVDPIILGRENDVLTIVEMLTSYPNEQAFKIVPIWGMGGLGKTTLARLVFGDEYINTHFDHCVWVHVSKEFNSMMIFKNILSSLTSENVEHGNREVLLQKLQKELGAKRYLLVLDDVWNEETDKWDNFISSLSGISSIRGNGIIVTTRSEKVASSVKTLANFTLQSLSENNCWSVIKAKAFRDGDILPEFECTGKNIAKRCQGLPLAANVVGGFLRDKSIDEWRSVEQSWLADLGDGNNILKILKLSYDNLSSPSLKKCFAYCSIFPKRCLHRKEELIELWMAEGFTIQTDQKMDMDSVGNKFFNILLESSLLQAVQRDRYGNVSYCSMHDLVHDLACSVLNHIYQNRYVGREYIRDESCPIPKEQARCLRTLFFIGKVSDIMLLEFKSLHVFNSDGSRFFRVTKFDQGANTPQIS